MYQVLNCLDTEDFPTQEGSAIYTGSQPGVDSAVVGICRAAGAIILGKTVSHLCLGLDCADETDNNRFCFRPEWDRDI
jgi:hypothetical protein